MEKSDTRPYLFAIIFIAIGMYLSTLTFDFAYDDRLHIVYNPVVTESSASITSLTQTFRKPFPPGDLYRPLTLLSYQFNFLLGGLDPLDYHFTNVLLYACCCALVYILVFSISRSPVVALFSASLFTVHPVHVEAVANIAGRSELLAALFGLLALLCFRKRSLVSLINGSFCFLFAVLSKESALTFLPLIPLAGLLPGDEESEKTPVFSAQIAVGLILLLAGAAVALALRKAALGDLFLMKGDGSTIFPENPLFQAGIFERFIPSLYLLGRYLGILILPTSLSADYSQMPAYFFHQVYSVAGLPYVAALALFGWILYQYRRKYIFYFGVWFLVTFLLTVNLITPIGTLLAERLAFTPSIGLIAFIVAACHDRIRNSSLAIRILTSLLGIALVLAFALLTLERIPVWRNNRTLFTQTLRDAPESPKSYYNYALNLYNTKHDLAGAERNLRAALSIHPTYVGAMRLLADIMLEKKDYARVEYWYRKILELKPKDREVTERLSKLLAYKEALAQGGKALAQSTATH